MGARVIFILGGVSSSILLWTIVALLWSSWSTSEKELADGLKNASAATTSDSGTTKPGGSTILANAPTTFDDAENSDLPPQQQLDKKIEKAAMLATNRDSVFDTIKSAFKSERKDMAKWKDASKKETLDKSADWKSFPLAAANQTDVALKTTTREDYYNKFNCCWDGNKREEENNRVNADVRTGKTTGGGTKRSRELYEWNKADGGKYSAMIKNFLELATDAGTKVGSTKVSDMSSQDMLKLVNNPESWLNESNLSEKGQLNRKHFLSWLAEGCLMRPDACKTAAK
eukprot:jgi/Mesvir1/1537/Mv14520-RA.1